MRYRVDELLQFRIGPFQVIFCLKQLPFRFLAFGYISDNGEYDDVYFCLNGLEHPKRYIHRKLDPIFPTPEEFQSRAHRPDARFSHEGPSMFLVLFPETFRHEALEF